MIGAARGWLVAALVLQATDTQAPPPPVAPHIEDLHVVLDDAGKRARVSFRVQAAFDDDTLDRIQSGIAVGFRHRIHLLEKRGFPLLPRRELARTRIDAIVSYDSLTGRYTLTRRIEVKSRRKRDAPPLDEQTRVTDSQDEMREWMTRFANVPLYDPVRPIEGENLKVKVESDLGRRYVLWMFPSTVGTSAEVELEP